MNDMMNILMFAFETTPSHVMIGFRCGEFGSCNH